MVIKSKMEPFKSVAFGAIDVNSCELKVEICLLLERYYTLELYKKEMF
jgi:hypothetical protein